MKKIEALIKPYKLEDVKNALNEVGVEGMTISEVKGFGKQKGGGQSYLGMENKIDFVPKIKLELVLVDSLVELASKVIIKSAKTGKIGDGKIFILPLEEAVHIRTGATGESAV
jgi:nitrogen regulatory protein P-II 1